MESGWNIQNQLIVRNFHYHDNREYHHDLINDQDMIIDDLI